MARLKKKPLSAVHQAAQSLRALCMEAEDGAFLGLEDDLMTTLGISRPTLRQAAAQVGQEHLLSIRRGFSGGYFASSPSSMTVARMAAIYLRKHDARLEHLVEAIAPIRSEIARLATRNINEECRRALKNFIEKERLLFASEVSYGAFLNSEREFARLLGDAGKNQVLTLFLGILYDFSSQLVAETGAYTAECVERYRVYRHRMVEAILEGDEEIAVAATRRCSTVMAEVVNGILSSDSNRNIGDLDTADFNAAWVSARPPLVSP